MNTEEKTTETQEVNELTNVARESVVEQVKTEETVSAETSPTEPEKPLTKEEQLNALINRRMGNFDLHITYHDLKYVRNSLNDKVEWSGPSEAYLLLIANLSITNTLGEMDQKNQSPVKVPFSSAVIESINYFFSKIKGKGMESAQKVFSVSMTLRPAMENIKRLDAEINQLKEELNPQKAK